MQFVDIKTYLIGQTRMNKEEVRKWLDDMGAEECPIYDEDVISDGEQLAGLAAKRCYKSFVANLNPNVTKVRKDWGEYFDNILKVGHGSVLEHTNYTWAFENVSRVFTAEMNRHRAGVAISEQSLRYVRFNDIPFWLPNFIRPSDSDQEGLARKKEMTRKIIERQLIETEQNYKDLVALWDFENMKDFTAKKQVTSLIRRIVPLGVATGGVWTMNGRAIRHVCTMRCEPVAEEEICFVFSHVAKRMCEEAKLLFSDFKQTPEGFWYPEHRKV